MSEVLCDLGRDRENFAVCNCGYTIDFAMMITNELHMFDECAKTLPAGKRRYIDE